GIGFGHLMVETLFEAMEHEKVFASTDFWQDIQAAVAALPGVEKGSGVVSDSRPGNAAIGNDSRPLFDSDAWRRHLQSAASRLLSAREVLYPVTIYLLDICLFDDERLGQPFPSAFDRRSPLNVIVPGALLEKLGREDPERLNAIR